MIAGARRWRASAEANCVFRPRIDAADIRDDTRRLVREERPGRPEKQHPGQSDEQPYDRIVGEFGNQPCQQGRRFSMTPLFPGAIH